MWGAGRCVCVGGDVCESGEECGELGGVCEGGGGGELGGV